MPTILIHEVHDMWPATLVEIGGMSRKHPFVWAIQKAEDSAYRTCDELISLLPYTKRYMKRHGLAEEKWHYIPNGIIEGEWKSKEAIPKKHEKVLNSLKEEGKFIVGYFGGHALNNALDILLDVAKNCEDKETVFVLVGDGVEKKRLMARKKDENIDNAIFLPAVPKKSIPTLVNYYDCIYMGAHETTLYRFGISFNKMFDSMMSGKPVILSVTAPSTLIKDFNCGYTVESGDIAGICSSIKKIKEMPDQERAEMGERGRQAVKDHFLYRDLSRKAADLFGEGKKNIVLINHYAGSPEMGMSFRTYYMAREWVKMGHRVDIIAADYSHLRRKNPSPKKDFQTENIDGITYHWIHTNRYDGNGIKRAMTMFEFVGKLWLHARRIIKECAPDVIITSSTYPLDTFAGQRIRYLSNQRR